MSTKAKVLKLATLDLWSNASSVQLRMLLRSAFASLLMLDCAEQGRPIYLCSPWISDFSVLDNRFGQFDDLVPTSRGTTSIRLSQCLMQLARVHSVRIISRATEATKQFLAHSGVVDSGIEVRIAGDALHEKGLLTPLFYLEGSMNITFSGVHINSEKVTYHSGGEREVTQRMGMAYLELNRRWGQLTL